jgi:hypothetical protein
LTLLLAGGRAFGGPPFQTDDPEPVDFHHYEFYTFSTFDRGGGSTTGQGPAFELNVGAAPNLQLHLVVPVAWSRPDAGPTELGAGDIEMGVKYRFIQEKRGRPQVGIFPMLELPSGNAGRGLGNGGLWARLPLWIQKSWGPWTTYGGGGYTINHAPGMQDCAFAGWLAQRQLGKRLILGGEVYYQGAQAVRTEQSTFLDGGGYLTLHGNLSLLFMGGHSVAGDRHAVGYLGLYYTWGKDRPQRSLPAPGTGPGRAGW